MGTHEDQALPGPYSLQMRHYRLPVSINRAQFANVQSSYPCRFRPSPVNFGACKVFSRAKLDSGCINDL